MKKLERYLRLPISLDDVLYGGSVECELLEYLFNLYEKMIVEEKQ